MRGRSLCLIAGSSLVVLAATPAAAQPAPSEQTFTVAGSAPQVCTMDRGRIQPGGLVNFGGLDGDTLQIIQLTDPTTLSARPASATIAFAAVCNFPHQIRIESENNGLWPTDGRMSSDVAGFAYALPYAASVSWGTTNGELEANAKVRQLVQRSFFVDQATAGNMELRIEIEAGASNVQNNAPVLASGYGDTLRIFLEPR
jgi:hypothetical protein